MRARVDPDRCEGNAVCVRLVPEVFELGEDLVRIAVPDVPAHLSDRVRHAVWACPKIALRLEEDTQEQDNEGQA